MGVLVVLLLVIAATPGLLAARWVNVTTPVFVLPGQPATILCQLDLPLILCVLNGPSGQTFQIQDDTVIQPIPTGYTQAGSTTKGYCGVTIANITNTENGNWTCSATPKGSFEMTTYILLYSLVKPGSISFPGFSAKDPVTVTDRSITDRDKAIIECMVYGGRPSANISWFLDNTTVTNDKLGPLVIDTMVGKNPNDIQYITKQNYSGYFLPEDTEKHLTCVYSHPALEPGDINSTSVEIIVKFPPQPWPDKTQTQYGFLNNQRGQIKVDVLVNPIPTVTWTFPSGGKLTTSEAIGIAMSDDKRISASPPQYKGRGVFTMTLTLDPVLETDANADFQLDVSNGIGSQHYSVKITSESGPTEGLSAGGIVGIVIGIPIILIIIAVVVFAKATKRWCFKPRVAANQDQPSTVEIKVPHPDDVDGTDTPVNQTKVEEKEPMKDLEPSPHVNGTVEVKKPPSPRDSPV